MKTENKKTKKTIIFHERGAGKRAIERGGHENSSQARTGIF